VLTVDSVAGCLVSIAGLVVVIVATLAAQRVPAVAVAAPVAALLILLGLTDLDAAADEVMSMAPTIGFLAAMLVVADVCAREGVFTWVGTVLAGPLAPSAPYGGPDSLREVLGTFLIAAETVLYEPPHERRILEDRALTVSGRPGWLLKFEMDFTEQSEINGWQWRTEVGALVLVDRGEDRAPALLFATVPDNLNARVVDQVIDSLQLV